MKIRIALRCFFFPGTGEDGGTDDRRKMCQKLIL